MASLDTYTHIRLAAKPRWRDHFHGLASIWDDSAATEISRANAVRDAPANLITEQHNWDGADGPRIANFWSAGIDSQGEQLTTSKVLGTPFSLPLYQPTATTDPADKLAGHLYAKQPLVVGYRSPDHPTGTRYRIGARQEQPPNRSSRLVPPIAPLPLTLKAAWGFLVEPHLQTEADSFTPTGHPDICWAIELTSITSGTVAITITPAGAIPDRLDGLDVLKSAASMTITWAGSRPSRMLLIPSPPFRSYRGYSSVSSYAPPSVFARIGALPRYLQPGQTYSVSATNSVASVCWLENHEKPI